MILNIGDRFCWEPNEDSVFFGLQGRISTEDLGIHIMNLRYVLFGMW